NITATTASLTLTANASTVNAATSITATTAALTLTAYAASLIPVISVDCTTAALTLTTYNADVDLDKNITATTASLTLTANVATVNAETSITATLAELVLAAYSADVNLNKNVSATTPSLTLTTFSATITAPLGQATCLSVGNFPQGATVEYQIVDALLGTLQAWTSTGVNEVQGPTKSAYYITTSVIGVDAGTSGVIYWRTSDLAYEASEAYDFVNIGLTLSRALAGGIAKEASVQAIPTAPLLAADYTAPDNATISTINTNVTGIKTKTDNLPQGVQKNTALSNFIFHMVSSSDGKSAATGLTVTAKRSIDGGAFASCANSATEIGSGAYKIDLATTDLNGDVICLLFTGSGAIDRVITILTNP
ncbi:MAG: hypothetical protein NUW09_02760, partial [Deltaproteobacteria bacterium]|nr:hypothetical protein [Deltaproteobacteria bacterium]